MYSSFLPPRERKTIKLFQVFILSTTFLKLLIVSNKECHWIYVTLTNESLMTVSQVRSKESKIQQIIVRGDSRLGWWQWHPLTHHKLKGTKLH
jgi:hypothetical protein